MQLNQIYEPPSLHLVVRPAAMHVNPPFTLHTYPKKQTRSESCNQMTSWKLPPTTSCKLHTSNISSNPVVPISTHVITEWILIPILTCKERNSPCCILNFVCSGRTQFIVHSPTQSLTIYTNSLSISLCLSPNAMYLQVRHCNQCLPGKSEHNTEH